MKKRLVSLAAVGVLCLMFSGAVLAESSAMTSDEYINTIVDNLRAKNYDEADRLIEAFAQEHPENLFLSDSFKDLSTKLKAEPNEARREQLVAQNVMKVMEYNFQKLDEMNAVMKEMNQDMEESAETSDDLMERLEKLNKKLDALEKKTIENREKAMEE